ncbi:McrC family protein [Pontibacter ruber]|uniref:McrC family protein n=1 Tax=Pontibacter ruber TaxID=1343895 RepID=A0ABW5CYR5_9BACT|nr:McrC family protein [Pontibacter ruber]
MSRDLIQVFEHQTLLVNNDSKFTDTHFRALVSYGYKTKEKYFRVGHNRIKFTNYVGVLQVKNLTIEVLPKADKADDGDESKKKWHGALIDMLHVCRQLKLDSIANASLKLRSASILDLYFDAFLSEVEKLCRHGLRKSYRTVAENLTKVKGKISFTEHIRRNYAHKEKVFVEHQVYDINAKLNQTILKALLVLSKISYNSSFTARIKRLLLHFDTVDEVHISSSWFDSIIYNRTTERYKPSIALAKMIILKHSPDLKGGREDVLALMFDMNALYENYVYRKLKVLEADSNIPVLKVREQQRKPFWERRGIKADIIIETEIGQVVIDTKWKVLKNNTPSDEDLKQMFVYGLHYDSPLNILLYPKTSVPTGTKKPFKRDSYKGVNCQVAFVNLFQKGSLLDKELGYKIYKELLEQEILSLAKSSH